MRINDHPRGTKSNNKKIRQYFKTYIKKTSETFESIISILISWVIFYKKYVCMFINNPRYSLLYKVCSFFFFFFFFFLNYFDRDTYRFSFSCPWVGQLKENLFLPLFNTNFILKFEINAGKGTIHFNPLEDYRFFHHWFSGVKTP